MAKTQSSKQPDPNGDRDWTENPLDTAHRSISQAWALVDVLEIHGNMEQLRKGSVSSSLYAIDDLLQKALEALGVAMKLSPAREVTHG